MPERTGRPCVHSGVVTGTSAAAVQPRRSLAAVSVFALVFLALVALVPQTFRPPLAGRVVVVFAGIAVGAPLAVLLAIRGNRAARWATAFVAWAALSAALSHAPIS